METTAKYDRLLKFMYDEYDRGHNDHGHGQRVRILVDHFERTSEKNRIGNANDKRAAVDYLHNNDWINIVDTIGAKIIDSTEAYTIGRMKPTPKGLEHLKQNRKDTFNVDTANAVASVSGTFFGNFFGHLFKILFGK